MKKVESKEPFSNLCFRKAGEIKPQGYDGDPNDLIGAYVKLPFVAECGHTEHMWVKVESVSSESRILSGELNNDPVLCHDIKCGDKVCARSFDEIESIVR